MQILVTFVSALLFGLGLAVSGLINPAKVLAFLDIAGNWDPSLAITMACAVAFTAVGYRASFARKEPLFSDAFQVPANTTLDRKLVSGAALFGIGWGLIGFCPGPAVAALSLGNPAAVTFIVAMLAGMAAARFVTRSPASKLGTQS